MKTWARFTGGSAGMAHLRKKITPPEALRQVGWGADVSWLIFINYIDKTGPSQSLVRSCSAEALRVAFDSNRIREPVVPTQETTGAPASGNTLVDTSSGRRAESPSSAGTFDEVSFILADLFVAV